MEKKKNFDEITERVKSWSTKKKIIYGCIFWVVLISVMVLIIPAKSTAPKSKQEKIEELFDPYFGYNFDLNYEIKKALHDPDSFEHVKTVYWDEGEFLTVQVTFRAKNRFGALVKHKVKATMDFDGVILAKALVE